MFKIVKYISKEDVFYINYYKKDIKVITMVDVENLKEEIMKQCIGDFLELVKFLHWNKILIYIVYHLNWYFFIDARMPQIEISK